MTKRAMVFVVGLVAASIPVLLVPTAAQAACTSSTVAVTSTADTGANTLRDALASVCDGGTINVTTGKGSTISLSTVGDSTYGPTALLVNKNVTINGGGVVLTRNIGAAPVLRLVYVAAGKTVTINDVEMNNGFAKGGNGGGGSGGAGGGAGLGGAIFNDGTLALNRSTLDNNDAAGGNGGNGNGDTSGGGGGGGMGGNGGTGNGSGFAGGGGGNAGNGGNGTATADGAGGPTTGGAGAAPAGVDGGVGGGGGGAEVGGAGGNGGFGGGGGGGFGTAGGTGGFGGGGAGIDEAFNVGATGGFGGGTGAGNNNASGAGGAGLGGSVFNNAGATLTVTNSTFDGNTALPGTGGLHTTAASGLGDDIFNYEGSVTVTSSTLVAGGAVNVYNLKLHPAASASLTLQNSIIGNCKNDAGAVTAPASATNLIITNSGCGTPSVTADPALAALADNGGLTKTRAIANTSSAFDAGSCVVGTDQRNLGRPGAGSSVCDIGAFELNGIPLNTANIAVSKSAPANATANTDLPYTITVSNAGPGPATALTLSDTLPANTTFSSIATGGGQVPDNCSNSPTAFSCTWNSLPNGGTSTINVVVHLTTAAAGDITNTATVSSTAPDNDTSNNHSSATTHVTNADLEAIKTGPSTAVPGTNISYTIGINNHGPTEATGVTLKDTPPPGVTFVSLVSTAGPAPDSCVLPPAGSGGDPTCTWNTLANGAMPRLVITWHISPATVGQRTNGDVILTNTFDPASGNNFSSAVTNIACANTITGTQSSLTLNGGSWCINGATVNGPVTAGNGAQVVIVNSRLNSSVSSSGAGSFALCGSTVAGGVSVSGTPGFVLIGDPGDDGCAANTTGGSVGLNNNTGGVEVAGNTRIGGNLSLTNNTGAGPFPEDDRPEVEANTIVGGLSCSNNSPGVKNDGHTNTAGAKAGQCAGL